MPNTPKTSAIEWFNDLTNNAPQAEAARKAGIPQSTLFRHLRENKLTPEEIIQLSRAYGRSPARALHETGHLTTAELNIPDPGVALQQIHTRELLNELTKRVLDDQLLAHSNTANQQVTGATIEHMNDYRPLTVHNDPYSVEYDETRHVALKGDELEPNELQEP